MLRVFPLMFLYLTQQMYERALAVANIFKGYTASCARVWGCSLLSALKMNYPSAESRFLRLVQASLYLKGLVGSHF